MRSPTRIAFTGDAQAVRELLNETIDQGFREAKLILNGTRFVLEKYDIDLVTGAAVIGLVEVGPADSKTDPRQMADIWWCG